MTRGPRGGAPDIDGWAYSRTWRWKRCYSGTAYMLRNLDWAADTYAGVVDDFGNLHIVGWTA